MRRLREARGSLAIAALCARRGSLRRVGDRELCAGRQGARDDPHGSRSAPHPRGGRISTDRSCARAGEVSSSVSEPRSSGSAGRWIRPCGGARAGLERGSRDLSLSYDELQDRRDAFGGGALISPYGDRAAMYASEMASTACAPEVTGASAGRCRYRCRPRDFRGAGSRWPRAGCRRSSRSTRPSTVCRAPP